MLSAGRRFVAGSARGASRLAVAAVWLSLGAGAALALPVDSAPAAPLDHFGAREGLAAETINALLVDRSGLLWIGTREGLFSYDGYRFSGYVHDVTEPASIVDNWVRTIFEDRGSTLWVGTNTGGLARLDRATGTFETFRHVATDPSSLSHDSVYAIADAPGGKLWVGTQAGFNLFDPRTGKADRIPLLRSDEPHAGAEFVLSIEPESDGTLWIATVGNGVLRFRPADRTVERLAIDPAASSGALRSPDAFALAHDARGNLWIGTRRGVAVRRTDGSIALETAAGRAKPALGATVIPVIASDPAGTVWIGSFLGLFRSRQGSTELEPVGEGKGQIAALPGHTVTALSIDRSGSLWIGTVVGGLYRLRSLPVPFRTIGSEGRGLSTLSYDEATAVLEDRAGRLWVGTFGGGVDRLDPGADRFAKAVFPRGSNENSRGVLHLAADPLGRIWIGATGGLFRFDPSGRTFAGFVHDPANPSSLGRGYVFAVLVDSLGRVWVGSGVGGLQRLRADERGFESFPSRPGDPATPSDNFVTVLFEDREGRIWEGTRSGGLNLIDRETGRARRIPAEPSNPEALAHHYVTSILQDRRGRIWIGTGGGGIARLVSFDEERGARFARVTARDGLIDDNVMALVEDDDGSFWISTRQGLTRFHPDRNLFVSYGTADGLPSSEGNLSAAARSRTSLWIGTMKGLIEIPRGTPFPSPAPPTLVLTALRTLGGPAAPAHGAWPPERVEVRYKEILTVEFAVADFDAQRRHRYAYRIPSRSTEWNDLGSRRDITFADLAPGEHVLEIRGRGARGAWSDPPLRLAIRVIPPFYLTPWFRFVVGLMVVASALAWHATRTARLERRNRELTELHAQREAALLEAKTKEQELQAAFDHLRQLTRRLEAAKEEERKHIARELHDEMGQLLTATKMNVQLLQRAGFDERAPKRLTDTVGLLDRMIRLVRELSFDLRPPLMDDLGLLAALRGHLEAIEERSGLRIRVSDERLPERLPPEVEVAAFRIVQEAVTNVVRHASATRVDVALRGGPDRLVVEVRDDGRGFEASASSGPEAARERLGLSGMIERAQALGGNVSIESSPGEGTTLRATLSWRS